MAGGRSLRMRSSLGSEHKALVKVLGVPMLERNIMALLSHGFCEIFLAVSAGEGSLLAFARGRATQLAYAGGAQLEIIVEEPALGTIGVAREIRTASEDLLVVNVDNLTALDLSALLNHHRSARAAMTIATHTEPFQVPFGQVSVNNGRIVAYHEKPVLPVTLSSGTYVLSKFARHRIPSGRAVGAPELVEILLREKRKVAAFEHSSPWIDVNDSASVRRAEELIMAHPQDFELWRESPPEEISILCVLKGGAVAVFKGAPSQSSAINVFPAMKLSKKEHNPELVVLRQKRADGLRFENARVLVSLDELDAITRKRTRYHVVVAESTPDRLEKHSSVNGVICWADVNEFTTLAPDSHGITRILAYLKRHIASPNSYFVCN